MCHWRSRTWCECQCLSTHSGAEQVPQIWVIWGIAERGLHGQGWRRGANTGSWSSEQLREGGCRWPSSVPYLFLLFLFFFANSDSRAQEQIQCDLRGPAGSWMLPSAYEKTSSLPSLFVLSHFTLVMCCSQWSALPAFCFFTFIQLLCLWLFLQYLGCFPHFLSVFSMCVRVRDVGT